MHINNNNNNKRKTDLIGYDFWTIIYKAMMVVLYAKKAFCSWNTLLYI